MPECYTHARIALKSLMRSGITVASQPAFLAGANGPDPLYMYKGFRRNPEPDLPAMAARMHREHTGDFLVTLLQYAITPLQQSYALGWLSHYAADCTLNPYMAAMCKKGMPYEGPNGQRRMEAAMDSTLYYADYKSYRVPVQAATPPLISEDLAQVSTLLHDAIRETYGQDISALALADTFHDNARVRKFLLSRTGLRKGWVRLLGVFYPDKRGGTGSVYHRMQPAKPLVRLPGVWAHPYTKEEYDMTLEEAISVAEQTGAVLLIAAMHYWLGEIEEAELRTLLNDNNYFTGLPADETEALLEEEQAPAPPPAEGEEKENPAGEAG